MALEQARSEIGETVQKENPGEEEVPVSPGRQVLIVWDGDPVRETIPEGKPRMREIGLRPPVQRRVSIEDLQSAHQQHGQAQDIHPVREPDP